MSNPYQWNSLATILSLLTTDKVEYSWKSYNIRISSWCKEMLHISRYPETFCSGPDRFWLSDQLVGKSQVPLCNIRKVLILSIRCLFFISAYCSESPKDHKIFQMGRSRSRLACGMSNFLISEWTYLRPETERGLPKRWNMMDHPLKEVFDWLEHY